MHRPNESPKHSSVGNQTQMNSYPHPNPQARSSNNGEIRTTPDEPQSPQASASTNSATRASVVSTDDVSQENGAASSDSSTVEKLPARKIVEPPAAVDAGNQITHAWMRRRSPTYHSWMAMRRRCLDRDFIGYANYGGRGITVCDRWRDSFEAFLEDMGEKPSGLSIDRVDVNGRYEPIGIVISL